MIPQFCEKDQIYNQVDIKVISLSSSLLENGFRKNDTVFVSNWD